MKYILITGSIGSGKTLLLLGLTAEYEARRYSCFAFDSVESNGFLSASEELKRRVEGMDSEPEFCVLTSLEPPEAFDDVDFFRVIRTGRHE